MVREPALRHALPFDDAAGERQILEKRPLLGAMRLPRHHAEGEHEVDHRRPLFRAWRCEADNRRRRSPAERLCRALGSPYWPARAARNAFLAPSSRDDAILAQSYATPYGRRPPPMRPSWLLLSL